MTLGRKAALGIFLAGLLVRLTAIGAAGFSTTRFGDARPYLVAATELARHGRYPDRTEPYFFRPPAYPAFLVAATLGRPECVACAKTANAVLGAASAVLLAFLSARIFGNRAVAVGTGLAAAFHPSFVLLSTDVQSEPLFLVLLLLSGLALLSASDGASKGSAFASGVLLGLAALTRPSALALAPLLAAPLFDRRRPRRASLPLAAVAAAGLLLALAPWTVRNALRYGELIPVSDAGGVSLYAGNSSWTRRYYELSSREEYELWLVEFDRDLRARLARIEASGAVSPARRSAGFARMALDETLADPGAALRLAAKKAWHWVRPYPTPWYWPKAAILGIAALYLALYAFAARGLLVAPRRGVAAFAVAVLVVSLAVHVVLQVVWRYRVPFWDPILLVFGVYGVYGVSGAFGAGRR
jgi:4-amino-4-deoxy-L-arabinose transferase-like glycosyltransferase